MGVFYETVPPHLHTWILAQKLFWVATAPLSAAGHVNVSPKGGPYFGLPDNKTFWYLDLSGSGNETIAHLYEPGNGRVTICLCAFEGAPKIVRLWGRGRVLEFGSREFGERVKEWDVQLLPGVRSIVVVDVHQAGSSCGFSVPFFDFKAYRPVLNEHWEKREKKYLAGNEAESMPRYWAWKNAWSVDGLPGMKTGLAVGRQEHIAPLKKFVGPNAPKKYRRAFYTVDQLILVAIVCLVVGAAAALYGPLVVQHVTEALPLHVDARLSHVLHLN